ncbi:L-lactate dehydrogenase (cytochrome) [Knoellia remsis]|uniref:L-lactate dehydrogenase (Cytochrome) n=1 Tax=Knoellia remsis TaxID=407159 RepID=A0A2T0TQ56_9MICO|nr:alpha-hydroxy acid oxidase [Knoellia remsis]PRY47820.1 L-lactate dehydrogenase (cytochrome) [Knoellia remsis]
MSDRQLPKWSELKPLLRPKPLTLNATDRRLAGAVTIADLRRLAKRRTPTSVFDYTDGAAEEELALSRARETFRDLTFHPRVLSGHGAVDTTTTVLGTPAALPFGFGPTGFTRMMQHEGEPAVARVAERMGIPYGLSTLGTTNIAELAAAAPGTRKWFQLYVWRDHAPAEELMAAAKENGFEALMLTVDCPVGGSRHRDVRNGFAIPPALTAKTVLDGAMHPNWWMNFLTTPPLRFASLDSWDGTIGEMMNALFDPTMSLTDLDWVRSSWDGPLIVKGVQTVEDARAILDHGADAIVLSNHGGRQLDKAPVPVRLLPRVREALGPDAEIMVDTGVMSGGDVVAAMALGASSVLVGRAYLYGLMAGGERGVQRAADILAEEVRRTMALLGAATVADLKPEHVELAPQGASPAR